ncbi:MAG: phage minor capsid protein, partial [Christensenella sp.]
MLTPDYLDGLPEPIVKILQNVEDFMIGDIARRVRKVGDATSTAEIQRIV